LPRRPSSDHQTPKRQRRMCLQWLVIR
jgi:hypothetical protein